MSSNASPAELLSSSEEALMSSPCILRSELLGADITPWVSFISSYDRFVIFVGLFDGAGIWYSFSSIRNPLHRPCPISISEAWFYHSSSGFHRCRSWTLQFFSLPYFVWYWEALILVIFYPSLLPSFKLLSEHPLLRAPHTPLCSSLYFRTYCHSYVTSRTLLIFAS